MSAGTVDYTVTARQTIKELQARIRKLEKCALIEEVYVTAVTSYTLTHNRGRRIIYTATDSTGSSATVGAVIDDGTQATFNFGAPFTGWITYQ